MADCPKKILGDIDRSMLLLAGFCQGHLEWLAYLAAVKVIGQLRKVIEKRLDIQKCKVE